MAEAQDTLRKANAASSRCAGIPISVKDRDQQLMTMGVAAYRLQAAIAFSVANECKWPRSMYLPDGQYIGTAHIGDKKHAGGAGPERAGAAARETGGGMGRRAMPT